MVHVPLQAKCFWGLAVRRIDPPRLLATLPQGFREGQSPSRWCGNPDRDAEL